MHTIKVYIKDKKEIVEIINTVSNEVIFRYIGQLGQLLSDFIHCDLSDVNYNMQELMLVYRKNGDNKSISLSKVIETLPQIHIFFYIYSFMLRTILEKNLNNSEAKKVIQSITHTFNNIIILQIYTKDIIEQCLDINNDNKAKISDKYKKILKINKEKYAYKFEITIENVKYNYSPEEEYGYKKIITKKSDFSPIVYPQKIEDIIYFLLSEALRNKTKFKRCKNCERYYVVTGKKNSEYCERQVDGTDKTCKEIGSVKSYIKKRNEDPIRSVYTKAYNTNNARIRYGMITKEEFHDWANKAREKREECKNGEITLEEFEYWLSQRINFLDL